MTHNEKKETIIKAIELISLLEDCNDLNFVDLIIECVSSGDTCTLEEELPY